MSAAKWHRQKAQDERDISEARAAAYPRHAERYAENAAHHATAADALEALAVPGVAALLAHAADAVCVTTHNMTSMKEVSISAAQSAALATLAKISSGGK